MNTRPDFGNCEKFQFFGIFQKNSLFKLNFKIEVLAKWTVADLGLFRTVLIQIMMSYLERLMSFIPVQNLQPVNRLLDRVPRLVALGSLYDVLTFKFGQRISYNDFRMLLMLIHQKWDFLHNSTWIKFLS